MTANNATKKLTTWLGDDHGQCTVDAQHMVDFLSEVLDRQDSLSLPERKRILRLLVKLAKVVKVFPRSLELEDVQCDLTNVVHEGEHGLIYKGEHQRKPICVKAVRIYEGGIYKYNLRVHAPKLILWAHMSHPNILPFFGIYFSVEEVPRMCIVSPWMENTNLLKYLKNHPETDVIPLVHDILSGLEYMHDCDIVHGDLKAQNVLVSGTNRAMLADFGVSRVMVTSTAGTDGLTTGSAYWMAPELFMNDDPTPIPPSDIWAFGCTCYEIITGMMPFHQFKSVPQLIGAFLRGNIIPLKPSEENGWNETKEMVWSVANRCWKFDPESRPAAKRLMTFVVGPNAADNRLENEYRRPQTNHRGDYDRILEVLNQVQNSQDEAVGPERPERAGADQLGVNNEKRTDKTFAVMIRVDNMGDLFEGPFSKFLLECAFENPETGMEDIWVFSGNSDVAFVSFHSIGAFKNPPKRLLVGVYQSIDQLSGFDRFSAVIGNGKIVIRTGRGVVIRGEIEGGPRRRQSFAGAGLWTKA